MGKPEVYRPLSSLGLDLKVKLEMDLEGIARGRGLDLSG
jgi:hypothetical protein